MVEGTASVVGVLFGLAGFHLISVAEFDDEPELLRETTADLMGGPRGGVFAQPKGSVPDVRARPADQRAPGRAVLVRAGLVLPTVGVPSQDLEQGLRGDRAARVVARMSPGVGLRSGRRP